MKATIIIFMIYILYCVGSKVIATTFGSTLDVYRVEVQTMENATKEDYARAAKLIVTNLESQYNIPIDIVSIYKIADGFGGIASNGKGVSFSFFMNNDLTLENDYNNVVNGMNNLDS